MTKIRTTEALLLKSYDVGDADQFCILLTKTDGRVTVIAKGARKAQSKFGGAMQSFQHLLVDLAEHSSGFYVRSAQCMNSFDHIRSDLQRFAAASRGAELLLHCLHDTEQQESIFTLAQEFFLECDRGGIEFLFPTFQLALLKELGLFPSFAGAACSSLFHEYVAARSTLKDRMIMPLPESDRRKLSLLCDELLREHLSLPLKASAALNAVS